MANKPGPPHNCTRNNTNNADFPVDGTWGETTPYTEVHHFSIDPLAALKRNEARTLKNIRAKLTQLPAAG